MQPERPKDRSPAETPPARPDKKQAPVKRQPVVPLERVASRVWLRQRARLDIPEEHYSAIRNADLARIRERIAGMDSTRDPWQLLGSIMAGIAGSAALAAPLVGKHSPFPAVALWIIAGMSAMVAVVGFLASRSGAKRRRNQRGEILADLDASTIRGGDRNPSS